MTASGIHQITAAAYHADPADEPSLSSHVAVTLAERSPWHAWTQHPKLNPDYQESEDPKFDVGTAAHALLLQGSAITEAVEIIRDDESVREVGRIDVDGEPFAFIVDADDWRTKAAKDTRAEARERGLTPLLVHQWEQVKAMTAAVREQLDDHEAEPTPFTDGVPEQALVWQEPNGVWCRALADWLRDDRAAIDDFKSTSRSADPHQWARTTMWSIGADVQAAFYLRGLQAVGGGNAATFRFVVAETTPPYACSVVIPSTAVLELASAKVSWAIDKWAECLAKDEWPGYPSEPVYAELPEWAHARWLERTYDPDAEEALV